MPIYEYACQKCGHVTEALRRIAEADQPQSCERCGSSKTRRAHSVFAAGGSSAGSETSLPTACGMGGRRGGGCCGGMCHGH